MKLKLLIIIYITTLTQLLYSNEVKTMEFNNKPVMDILLAIAQISGKNIIPDSTVTGNCSYYFTTENMEYALEQFLISQKLYIDKNNGVYNVSKIHIDGEDLLTVKCSDTNIDQIINKLSSFSGVTILFDKLPTDLITLNIINKPLDVVLSIIIKKFTEYSLTKEKDYFYIEKLELKKENSDVITNGITIDDSNKYSINLNKVRFSQVLDEFFTKSNVEYSLQGRNDIVIPKLVYKDKDFLQMLYLILEEGSSDYQLSNNIYYIFDINKSEIANRLIETQVIKLKHILVNDLVKIIPGTFMNSNVFKVDEDTNSIIIYGTAIKTEPIINFIKLTDTDKKRKPHWIKMNFIGAEEFKNIILKEFHQSSIVNIDKESILILLTDDEHAHLQSLKALVDIAPLSHTITLKYIKSSQLLESLPKSISKDDIVTTPNPSVIYFYGEEDAYRVFLIELDKMDRPVPLIKYKVLVLQNSLGEDANFGISTRGHSKDNGDITLPDGEWNSFSGSLGSLLGLNFNVLSAFGPLFSFELNASLTNNKTKVLVDTTLQALSGKKVSFRNTTTSRFYQTTVDSDGSTETGATQEVSWGIILDIEGWTSGDGMVTVNVQSTLSDETTLSGDSSGIPSTSEKIVNTEVRTRVGEPIVIGGLISSKKELTLEKTPILGDIPLLGFFFRKNVERESSSEFTIYLLPTVEDELNDDIGLKIERAYKELL